MVGERRGRRRGEYKERKREDVLEDQCFPNLSGHANHLVVLLRCRLGKGGLGQGCESAFLRSSHVMLLSLVQDPRVRSQVLGIKTLHLAKRFNNKGACVRRSAWAMLVSLA